MTPRGVRLAGALLVALAISACASATPSMSPTATASPAMTPGPSANATPSAIASIVLDPNVCPEDWRSAMHVAWGYADDLAAPRAAFTTAERRMDLDMALPLVEAIPRWQPGEVVRTGLAHLFALHVAIEAAHASGNGQLEASLLHTADEVLRQVLGAWTPMFDEATDPCYRPGEGGAGG